MSADDRTPAPLTPASRTALAHYRAQAKATRQEIAVLHANTLARIETLKTAAARWDALADELEAFGEQIEHHEGQGELL